MNKKIVKEGRKSKTEVSKDKFRAVIYPTEDEIIVGDMASIAEAIEFYYVFSISFDIAEMFREFYLDTYAVESAANQDTDQLLLASIKKKTKLLDEFIDYTFDKRGPVKMFERDIMGFGPRKSDILTILGSGIELPYDSFYISEGMSFARVIESKFMNKISTAKNSTGLDDFKTEPVSVSFAFNIAQEYSSVLRSKQVIKNITNRDLSGPDRKKILFRIADMAVMQYEPSRMADQLAMYNSQKSVKTIEDINIMQCVDKFEDLALFLKNKIVEKFHCNRFAVFNSLLTTFGETPTGSYAIKIEV